MSKKSQAPRKYFDQACRASGLEVRCLQNTARASNKTVGELAHIASMVSKMGYNPKRLSLVMGR